MRDFKTLAIFDNDPALISICADILTEMGWKIWSFTDCNDIVAKLRDTQPDVVILDNSIPTCGGVEAARILKQEEALQDIPLIYLSANYNIREIASSADADYYLLKPFGIDELISAVSDAFLRKPSPHSV
ncbi:response regulator [Niabella insulamsoli]|uniref:response regulator n=1 Tax=Niabella insulamsoli TaxID=3144874 RepID=UPI0031FBB918